MRRIWTGLSSTSRIALIMAAICVRPVMYDTELIDPLDIRYQERWANPSSIFSKDIDTNLPGCLLGWHLIGE
jgi:hypothetical protein